MKLGRSTVLFLLLCLTCFFIWCALLMPSKSDPHFLRYILPPLSLGAFHVFLSRCQKKKSLVQICAMWHHKSGLVPGVLWSFTPAPGCTSSVPINIIYAVIVAQCEG
uniref:Uncharacterized protein n=1 Tax=Rhipicephalus microplus TaxID=6941 RepID=A0A6G5AER6_RHIMP